jgi:uncharacterized protein
MDNNDRMAIEDLFRKLADAERQTGPRDPEAEAFIRDRIANQPAAPYLMAQTIVVQEQALNAAQAHIEQLEYELSRRQSSGGFFSSLFGGAAQPRSAPPRMPPPPAAASPSNPGPWGRSGTGLGEQTSGRGGGFLAGAAQTAMGVAGGMMLGNALSGMFGGTDAHAADKDDGKDDNADNDSGGDDDGGFFDL